MRRILTLTLIIMEKQNSQLDGSTFLYHRQLRRVRAAVRASRGERSAPGTPGSDASAVEALEDLNTKSQTANNFTMTKVVTEQTPTTTVGEGNGEDVGNRDDEVVYRADANDLVDRCDNDGELMTIVAFFGFANILGSIAL